MIRNLLPSIIASTFLMTTAAAAHADAGGKPSDDQLTVRVKSQLAEKDREIAQRIQVSSQDGVVTLSGDALTPQYMLNVVRDAGKVDGVVKVQNHLTLE